MWNLKINEPKKPCVCVKSRFTTPSRVKEGGGHFYDVPV